MSRTGILVVGVILLATGCRHGELRGATSVADQPSSETILDRRIRLEPQLILEVPGLPPWCDLLELHKQRVSVGDCELYCETEGAGLPLVLINGGPGGTHHDFHPAFSQAAAFAQVIYYDQRGCGLSDYEPGEGYSLTQAVEDLDALRRGLSVDRWVVLGHSYGGLLAQLYATRHPDHVAGLVLVGSKTAMPPRLPSREYTFLSDQEQARIGEVFDDPKLTSEQALFNAKLNGDWKRQNFYRPTRERLARKALYGWKHDPRFRAAIGALTPKVDLRGAFTGCPLPTLIVEGQWDLTWTADKPHKLHANHPQARLVVLERSGHSPFHAQPREFSSILRDFVEHLPAVSPAKLASWKQHLAERDRAAESSPAKFVLSLEFGWQSSKQIAAGYRPDWLENMCQPWALLRTGLALYDLERYEEALPAFRKLAEVAHAESTPPFEGLGLVWQGHMLDLLGRRDEALDVYRQAVDLNVTAATTQGQYGVYIVPSTWARARLARPFQRIENLWQPREDVKSTPSYIVDSASWGRADSQRLAALYTPAWLAKLQSPQLLMRVGLALYDARAYEAALPAFQKMFSLAQEVDASRHQALALIWQGHVLDLLGRRSDAVAAYRQAIGLNVSGGPHFDQYNLDISNPTAYATERIREPFTRKENDG
jgi:proline iminopeptidase